MKWIKASERLPELNKFVFAKIIYNEKGGEQHLGYFHSNVKQKFFWSDRIKENFTKEAFKYIEWLDESQPKQKESVCNGAIDKTIEWLKDQEAICQKSGNQSEVDTLNGHVRVALSLKSESQPQKEEVKEDETTDELPEWYN
ncbi:MAG TPA: hypothetical protein VIJ57_05640 [Hanamia sp.]